MRSIIGLSVLLTLTAPSNQALATDILTLGVLKEFCASPNTEVLQSCRFFILGAFKGLSLAGSIMPGAKGQFVERPSGKMFCIPEDLAPNVMVQQVIGQASVVLKAYPGDAEMPAVSFIASVIIKRYPCD